jgi:hypothetical protein
MKSAYDFKKNKLAPVKYRVDEIYPHIRQQIQDTDDPDKAYDFLNIAIMNGMITAGKAQKIFNKRFPKEALQDWLKFIAQKAVELDPEMQAARDKAIADRIEAIKNLGLSPEEFEKQMAERLASEASLDNP